MATERLRDKSLARAINGNTTNLTAFNLMVFPSKYRCFQALSLNCRDHGCTSDERLLADGKGDFKVICCSYLSSFVPFIYLIYLSCLAHIMDFCYQQTITETLSLSTISFSGGTGKRKASDRDHY